jgi:hypothetical protein
VSLRSEDDYAAEAEQPTGLLETRRVSARNAVSLGCWPRESEAIEGFEARRRIPSQARPIVLW